MSTVATIRSAIKTKLDAISSISFVYDHSRAVFEGYPAVVFELFDFENSFLTTADNLQTYTFRITIFQETKIQGLDSATDLVDTVQNDIIIALEGDFSLTGEVVWCNPTLGDREITETGQGLVVTQDIDLKCNEATQV